MDKHTAIGYVCSILIFVNTCSSMLPATPSLNCCMNPGHTIAIHIWSGERFLFLQGRRAKHESHLRGQSFAFVSFEHTVQMVPHFYTPDNRMNILMVCSEGCRIASSRMFKDSFLDTAVLTLQVNLHCELSTWIRLPIMNLLLLPPMPFSITVLEQHSFLSDCLAFKKSPARQ